MDFGFRQQIYVEDNSCELRVRPGDTVLTILERLRERAIPEPFQLVKGLQLVPNQIILLPGCGIGPGPIPIPEDCGCRGLLEVAFAAIKTTDTKILPSEVSIGLARLRPSARGPINGFHPALIRVPVLVISNDRFVNPFTGKNVPGVNLSRLSPDAWELVQPVLGDDSLRRISVFDLTSVAAFLSQDSTFKTVCPNKLSVAYNPRCLGLLEALDGIEGLGVYPATYMAQVDSVYVRKQLVPDAVVPDWIETIGGSVLTKVVNGVTTEKVIVVPALSLYDYLRNIGARTCVPNGLLFEDRASFQEQITIEERLGRDRISEQVRIQERFDQPLTFGQPLAYDRTIAGLGNTPRELTDRLTVQAATDQVGSTGVPLIDRVGYNSSPYIDPTRFNSTERYTQPVVIGGQICRADPVTGAFKCWNPN